MVVTSLSRWMTWSTCEWLRWWLLDSVAGWRGLPVSDWDGYLTQSLNDVVYLWVTEMVTRLSRWMTWSTCEWLRWLLDSVAGWRGLPVSDWDGYLTQSLDDMVYLWVTEMVTWLSRWMTWSTCEWLRWSLLDYWVISDNQYENCLALTVFCVAFRHAILNKMCTEKIEVFVSKHVSESGIQSLIFRGGSVMFREQLGQHPAERWIIQYNRKTVSISITVNSDFGTSHNFRRLALWLYYLWIYTCVCFRRFGVVHIGVESRND